MPDPSPFSLRQANGGLVLPEPVITFLEGVSGLGRLQREYRKLSPSHEPEQFLEQVLDYLAIDYSVPEEEIQHIPREGGLIIVANHPFGALDGIILTYLLLKIRGDVRLLANFLLQSIPEMRDLLISCDPFERQSSLNQNRHSLKESIRWLNNGGALVIFPAGEVSHFRLRQGRVVDPRWHDTAARLAIKTGATVVPVYLHGRNSLGFQLAGMLHPWLRTILLPRELMKHAGRNIRLKLGKPLAGNKLAKMGPYQNITRYLRFTTYMLEITSETVTISSRSLRPDRYDTEIVSGAPAELQQSEINYLPASQHLSGSGAMEVYYARSGQIPWLLQEIGRLREITFREAGEGTGNPVDLDFFDAYYLHFFVWNREKCELVGAYRLGLTDEILNKYGKRGLYTHTLFKYRHNVLTKLNPAIELGRSFVRPEYQCSYLALNLLWKGIGTFVAKQEKYPVLFGPVSISNEYNYLSRKLMVDCLTSSRLDTQLSPWIKPRRPFRNRGKNQWKLFELSGPDDIDLVSSMVSQIEKDNKGIPVLFRQYLKLGGRFLSFNVDEEFSDVIDGLIMVDLRMTDHKILDKYMGRENAMTFLEYHRQSANRTNIGAGA